MADGPEAIQLDLATCEASVPHVDPESFPKPLAGTSRICRATIAHDDIQAFVISPQRATAR
ncbi:hypothetical protein [uncultured Sulfitobacter sp.]|uniref:hypothetical protein n=1 Tax=uncultured Sulfitobacter sp. TaxID=191468 RepID=UPI00260DFD33|nr:hypothetical protein [uncultured Sulfitobacter sp.]